MQQEQEQSTPTEIVNFPRSVKAFGREYQIKRFTMGPLIRALPHIAPLGYLMRSIGSSDASDILVHALTLAGEPALGLISVATEEPIEWLEEQDPIDGLEILTATVEENASYFFDSANSDRIKAAFARIEKVIETHGGDISKPSSAADTAH